MWKAIHMYNLNVPDDWDNYYIKCPDCGRKYHASETYCPCEDEEDSEDKDSEDESFDSGDVDEEE